MVPHVSIVLLSPGAENFACLAKIAGVAATTSFGAILVFRAEHFFYPSSSCAHYGISNLAVPKAYVRSALVVPRSDLTQALGAVFHQARYAVVSTGVRCAHLMMTFSRITLKRLPVLKKLLKTAQRPHYKEFIAVIK